MAKLKLRLPEVLEPNDTIMLKDAAWAFLFPAQWPEYRLKASKRNVAKVKVISNDGNDKYTLEMMEIAPEEGRLLVPTGMRIQTKIIEIHLAMVSTALNE
jgi:hypothetical protein